MESPKLPSQPNQSYSGKLFKKFIVIGKKSNGTTHLRTSSYPRTGGLNLNVGIEAVK